MAKLLVVDDNIKLLAVLSLQLEEAGYEVRNTSDIAQAATIFADEQPDLVLLEVNTAEDAGWDLLQQFAPQAPVMVVSANGREEDVVRAMEAGAVDYITKPYRSAELLTRVRVRVREQSPADTNHAAVDSISEEAPAAARMVADTTPQSAPPDPISSDEPLPASAAADGPSQADAEAQADAETTVVPPTLPRRSGSRKKEEPVFISETEELALLRANSDPETEDQTDTVANLPLGERLHTERLRRRVTLVQAESELHIRMWYLQAMEEEKFALLPRGQMAGDMLKAYAQYLGLDVDNVMAEYHEQHYTPPVEPPNHLGSTSSMPRISIPRWAVPITAIALALVVSLGGIAMFDPDGVSTLGNNLRGLIVEPSATPTQAPTNTPTATSAPTATPTEEPTVTPEPPPTPIPPPPPPITSTDELTPTE